MAITVAMQNTVAAMYAALFNRAAEKSGLDFWCGQLDSGVSLAAMAQTMYETAPARATYPDGISNADVVKAFYLNVLGRAGDAEGLAFWEARLNTLGTKGALIAEMVANVQSYAGTDADGVKSKALFDNKVAVGFAYAVTLGKEDVELAKSVLALVTDTDTAAALSAANVGSTFTLTTDADMLVGTTANDTFNGDKLTYANADRIVDASITDADELNLAGITGGSVAATFTAKNVEKININSAQVGGTFIVNADKMSGVKELFVGRANLASGINGKGAVTVQGLDASKVAKVEAAAGVTSLTVTQSSTATATGIAVNATGVTGNVTVTGPATVNANDVNSLSTVSVQGTTVAALDAGNVVVNAAKAGTVNVGNTAATTGTVTINAAEATTINASVAGGGEINAAKATSVAVTAVDDSGIAINVGTYAKTAPATVTITGTAAGGTDAASVKAAGFVNVSATDLESLTLAGNGAAATYTITGGVAKITAAGDQSITVSNTFANLTGKTFVDSTTAGTTTVAVTGTAAADTNLSKVAADLISIRGDVTADVTGTTGVATAAGATSRTLTVATGANVQLAADQSDINVAAATTKATLNLSTGDDTNADGSTIQITAGDVLLTGFSTVNLDATTGKFASDSFTTSSTTTLNVSGSKDVQLSTGTGTNSLVAKSIVATGLTGALTATLTAGSANLSSGSGADQLTINGATIFTVDAGDGDNVVAINGADSGSSVATGTGGDTVTVSVATAVAVVTGAGNDTVNLAGNAGASDAILSGGEGTDTLNVTADVSARGQENFAFSGFETVNLSGGFDFTITSTQLNAAKFTLKADAANSLLNIYDADIGAATPAANVLDASNITVSATNAPKVVIYAGSGSNTIKGTAADTDTINLSNMYGVNDVTTAGATTSTGIVINLGSTAVAADAVSGTGAGYLSGGLTSVAAGTTSYLFATSKTANSASVSTVSGVENIIGTEGADYIVGSSAANVITGGKGADYVKGGAGADTVVFAALNEIGDTIGDFVAATDKISLSKAAFGLAGAAGDATLGADFASVATEAALATSGTVAGATDAQAVIFVASTGNLYYNADGATAGGLTLIATLTGVSALAATDFVIAV